MTETCCICLDDMTKGSYEPIIDFPCGHRVHSKCGWELVNKTCPLCRKELPAYVFRVEIMGKPDVALCLIESASYLVCHRSICNKLSKGQSCFGDFMIYRWIAPDGSDVRNLESATVRIIANVKLELFASVKRLLQEGIPLALFEHLRLSLHPGSYSLESSRQINVIFPDFWIDMLYRKKNPTQHSKQRGWIVRKNEHGTLIQLEYPMCIGMFCMNGPTTTDRFYLFKPDGKIASIHQETSEIFEAALLPVTEFDPTMDKSYTYEYIGWFETDDGSFIVSTCAR